MTENIHLLAGAYALDALPLDERAVYERHLASCEVCEAEVAGYAETAARLGVAAATIPPEDLRRRVLAAAASTRQLSPAERRAAGLGRRLRPVLLPVAAGLAAVAVGLSGLSAYLWDDRRDLARSEEQMADLLARAERVTLDAPAGVSAGFLHSQDDDEGMLVISGLPPLDAERDYQLWLFHEGVPLPAGVFAGEGDGTVIFPAEAPVTGAEVVAVTVEPAGGLDAPSGEVLLLGEL